MKKHLGFGLSVTAIMVNISGAAVAQTNSFAQVTTASSLGEVVVTGEPGALSPRRVLSSVNVLPAERIQNQPGYGNFEIFNQVPGVLAGEYLGKGAGYGTFSIRGFNGEGVLNAVKLLIDGVPSNANDGNTYYVDLVPRLDIEAVELVKGTNDPRYGLHNIAGNATLLTRQGGNYTLGRASVGSFGSASLQLVKGVETDRVAQNYAFGYQTTRGFRDHSDASAINFSGKWFLKSEDGKSRVGLLVRHLQNQAQEPGYLSAAQLSANRWQAAPTSLLDKDERRASQWAIQAESKISNELHLSAQLYKNDLYDQRYIQFPDASRQERRLIDENHAGASVNVTYRFGQTFGQTFLGNTVLVAGLDTERQDNQSFRNRPATQTLLNVIRRDHVYRFNTTGGFVQAVIKPTERLTITPAYRVDKVTGSADIVVDTATTAGRYAVNDPGLIKQPKLSAAYQFSPAVTAYSNWGRSFQVGTGKAAYQTTAFNSPASINKGWEAGLKLRPASGLDARIALWRQTASSESRTLLGSPSNDTVNLGQTRRSGFDIELNAKPAQDLSVWGGLSVQRAQILSTGREVDHVPRWLYSAGVDYRLSSTWRLGAALVGQSNYFVDTVGPEKVGSYALTHVSASYQFSRTLEFDVQIRNLANRQYVYSYDNSGGQNFYAPNAPRSLFAGVSFKL